MFGTVFAIARRAALTVGTAAYRFYWDDLFSRASSLAYTTLFALVPISVIVFQLLPALGLDEKQMAGAVNGVLEQIIPDVDNLAPYEGTNGEKAQQETQGEQNIRPENRRAVSSSENGLSSPKGESSKKDSLKKIVYENLLSFSRNVRALNTASIVLLVLTGILLVNTIESALNVIWRVTSNVGIVSKIITFWAVITIGPMLLSLSFYWHARVWTLAENSPVLRMRFFQFWNFFLPLCLTWALLMLLYTKLPSASVRLRDASFGAVVAALLFQFVKQGFAWYMSLSVVYRTMYGAFMTVPVFLFWLYVAWVVALFGAEIAYQSGSIDLHRGLRKYRTQLGEVGVILGLRILHFIGVRFVKGEVPPTESEVSLATGSDPVLVRTCLELMTEANLLTMADETSHARTLARSPNRILVGDVLSTFLSRKHAEHLEKNGKEEKLFLEVLREKVLKLGDEKPLRAWSLRELIAS